MELRKKVDPDAIGTRLTAFILVYMLSEVCDTPTMKTRAEAKTGGESFRSVPHGSVVFTPPAIIFMYT